MLSSRYMLLGVCLSAALAGLPLAAQASRHAAQPVVEIGHHASTSLTGKLADARRRKPFRIKAGKLYNVTARVHGVRKHQRLGFEVYYQQKWHLIGSWKMHPGSYHFRGKARTSHPGLYTLRVQFLNKHHHRIKGTQSNSFKVKVLRFHAPKIHRPKAHESSPALAAPKTTLTDWTGVQCAQPLPGLGHGLYVPSPLQRLDGSEEVNQVVWARDALPGGNYGSWYIAKTDEQYLHPADPNIITITGAGDIKNSSYLDDVYFDYPATTEYHQIAWDLQIQGSDGLWRYISDSWYTPPSYIQWSQDGLSTSQSQYCLTYYQQAGKSSP